MARTINKRRETRVEKIADSPEHPLVSETPASGYAAAYSLKSQLLMQAEEHQRRLRARESSACWCTYAFGGSKLFANTISIFPPTFQASQIILTVSGSLVSAVAHQSLV